MSGGPSSRTSDAAERSQAVYFANLKEDMLLHKELHVLKRAENSLVHRIAIDQKIMFRRFQAKLRRSKIALARLWGDKDSERELRARDLHVMNSSCGQAQDDFDFLKKLKRRPCVVDEDDGNQDEKKEPEPDEKMPELTDEDTEAFIRAVMEDQVLPPTERNLENLAAIGRLLEEAQLLSLKESDIKSILTKPESQGHKQTTRAHSTERELRTDLKENASSSSFRAKKKEDKPAPSQADNQKLKDGPNRLIALLPSVKSSNQAKSHAITKRNKVRPQTSQGLKESPVRAKPKLASASSRTSSPGAPPNSRAKSAHGSACISDGSADTKAKSAVGIRGSSADRESKHTTSTHDRPAATRAKSAHSTGGASPVARAKSARSRPTSSIRSGSARARTPSPYKPLPGTQSLTPLPANLTRSHSAARTSSSARKSSAQPVALSMFEEQKKVDWVALRLEDARNTDLTPKVSAFLKTLLDLDKKERAAKPPIDDYYPEGPPLPPDSETDITEVHVAELEREEEEEEDDKEELKGDRKFDYYATKMALQAASVKKDRLYSLPGTPEEVNMKLVGDNTIKSITMPGLVIHQHKQDQEKDREDFALKFEMKTQDILTLD
ncbi:serine/threonine-protein kinase PRP4 homolog [Littorina saxatilis]|uniref:Uncharacterized protein n=1 Tax=Littorina saxatilis TaxID=31220 RepID=A0AAN9B2J7_9CAEN